MNGYSDKIHLREFNWLYVLSEGIRIGNRKNEFFSVSEPPKSKTRNCRVIESSCEIDNTK